MICRNCKKEILRYTTARFPFWKERARGNTTCQMPDGSFMYHKPDRSPEIIRQLVEVVWS